MATPGVLIKQPWSLQVDEITSISVPQMTTAERDNLVSPPNGVLLYNSTMSEFQVRRGTSWLRLVGASTHPYPVFSSSDPTNVGPLIAPDGGATATLATVGAGPVTAAQNRWLQIALGGVTYYLPLWV